MRRRTIIAILCLAAVPALSGCLGRFAANQGRRQAARSADYYVRTYAEPEINEMYGNDPNTQQQTRQARNDIADTIVRSGNERQVNRVGVNDRGWLTEER